MESEQCQKLSEILPIMLGRTMETRKMICSKHGSYEQSEHIVMGRMFKSVCPKCLEEVEKAEKTADSRIEWLSKRRENMRLDNYVVYNDDQRKIVERCVKYTSNFEKVMSLGSCLTLIGNPGTGKTHLATAIALEVMNNGYSVSYKRLYNLMLVIKATYGKGATDTEAAIIKRLAEYDLLVLDEVGLKNFSETEVALTYQIIDTRYEAVKPTVIVSNLNLQDLEACIGTRTIDRLFENHGAVLTFGWESERRKKR